LAKELKLDKAELKKLRAFTMHNVHLHKVSGNQVIGDCPFCNKDFHFYINKEKLLWDCKVCGESGNLFKFLDLINERNKKNLTDKALRRLARDRNLPKSSFRNWELGFHEGQYSIAVRDIKGQVQDLRLFKIGHKVISTSQAKTGLFGLHNIIKDPKAPVYICEGEWDTIAMQYLLRKAKAKGNAVCSPGANVFKVEWVEYFKQRKVYVCYDHDKAGDKGQEMVAKRLNGITSGVRFLHWPPKFEIGYDIRDFIVNTFLKTKKPKAALQKLLGYVRTSVPGKEETDESEQTLEAPTIDPSITIEDAFRAFESKMHNPDRGAIELCFISLISNLFGTRPLWYFLVAPPSSGKTEIINGFKFTGEPYDILAHYTSNLTSHTLISGMKLNQDPSLLATFENSPKTLFIKDFTPILSGNENEKNEIFGQLRDSYDGYSGKDFGNGVKRRYNKLNFSIISGVTFQIYDEASLSNSLGERFGKYVLPYSSDLEVQMKMMHKGMDNIGKEENLDDHTSHIVYSAVKNIIARIEKEGKKLPTLPHWARDQIGAISMYTAHMRSGVSRDRFRRDFIKSKPTVEMPMRLCTMLATTAIMRALVYGRSEVNEDDLKLIRKIALDTVNQRDEEILRQTYKLNKSETLEPTKRNIQRASSYTSFTVEQVIQDFAMVGVLKVVRTKRKIYYEFTDNMKTILDKAFIYKTQEELDRASIAYQPLERKAKRQSGKRKKKLVFKKGD